MLLGPGERDRRDVVADLDTDALGGRHARELIELDRDRVADPDTAGSSTLPKIPNGSGSVGVDLPAVVAEDLERR